MSNQFEIDWDELHGAVYLQTSSFASKDEIGGLAAIFVPLLQRSRDRNGVALVLVDMSSAPVQSLDFMAAAKGQSDTILQKGDRFAIVVSSSLVKSQLTRVGSDILTYNFFISRSAAETWLFAYLR